MICHECGNEHAVDELELAFVRPDDVAALSPEEIASRVQENKDLSIIDGKRFFIRGLISLPVISREPPYSIGAWVEVEQTSFERVYELWSEPDQETEPAFPARLANSIPTLPETLGIGASLLLTGPTTRPQIIIDDISHPLGQQQREGINQHVAHEYSALIA
jgi:hypothetical protein